MASSDRTDVHTLMPSYYSLDTAIAVCASRIEHVDNSGIQHDVLEHVMMSMHVISQIASIDQNSPY